MSGMSAFEAEALKNVMQRLESLERDMDVLSQLPTIAREVDALKPKGEKEEKKG